MKDLYTPIEVLTVEDLIKALEEIFIKNDDIQEQNIKDFNKRNYNIKRKKKTRRSKIKRNYDNTNKI